jgi:F-type H+-transporting ATPase subunit gamma
MECETFLPVPKGREEEEGEKQPQSRLHLRTKQRSPVELPGSEYPANAVPEVNLDTHASEHGARMTAMDKATENADELLRDLKYRLQQSASGSDYQARSLEIVGGAAASGEAGK